MEPQGPESYVYLPASQSEADAAACRELLEQVGAGLWITEGPGVPTATLLPTLWSGDRLISHASAANLQFPPGTDRVACRVVVQGPHTYVSPRWYPSVQPGTARGRATGRAVGTWDYEQVQFAGWLRTHTDPRRLREEVRAHAEWFDAQRMADSTVGPSDAQRGPWRLDEAPREFIEAMLRGIVGLELEITDVVGRFKLSQNRTQGDRDGVATGLRERGRDQDLAVADAVDRATPLYP